MADEQQRVAVVLSTVPDIETGRRIARSLVTQGLAACVNVVPGVTSIYRWQGDIQEDAELLLVCKARAADFPQVSAAIKAAHPYDVPEIIALPIDDSSDAYRRWLLTMTERDETPQDRTP